MARRPSRPAWGVPLHPALVVAVALTAPAELGSESLTLSTYYPSPLGVYRELVTTGAGGSDTLLARDDGRVGIGLSGPAATIHVRGRDAGDYAARFEAAGSGPAVLVTAAAPGDNALSAYNASGTGALLSGGVNGAAAVGGPAATYGLTSAVQNPAGYSGYFTGGRGLFATSGEPSQTAVRGENFASSGVGGTFQGAGTGAYGRGGTYGVLGQATSPTGYSGFFSGGQGVYSAEGYQLPSGGAVRLIKGFHWISGTGYNTTITKPSCPAGMSPAIVYGFTGTPTVGGVDGNDYVGAHCYSHGNHWHCGAGDWDCHWWHGDHMHAGCTPGNGTGWALTGCS